MKRRVLLQLGIPLLILCALFLLLAYPADRTLRPQPLLEVSVILRETDASLWTNARQGMEISVFRSAAKVKEDKIYANSCTKPLPVVLYLSCINICA